MKKVGKINFFSSFMVVTLLILGFGLRDVALAAEEPTVQAIVDSTDLFEGEQFQVLVRVSSSGDLEAQPPRIPNLDGFSLLNTFASQSTSRRLENGPRGMEFKTQRVIDYTYLLMPTKKGRMQIPAFEVVVNGKTQLTKPIVVNVMEGSAQRPSRPSAPQRGMPDEEDPLDEVDQMFQQLLQRHGMRPPGMGGVPGGGANQPSLPNTNFVPKNPNETFVVHLDLDKDEVFEGEQITATWSILVRGQILNLDRTKFPDLKGFWKEVIDEASSLNFATEVINGITYRRALLASYALFPIKAGTAIVDEYRLKATMQATPFGQAYNFNRSSELVKVKVKPLPAEGKPSNFTGAVGQFDVSASVEGQSFSVNQPFSLKVRFEGAGNAKMIELPPLNVPPGIEVYETKSESKFFKNGRSYKEFEVLLIPRQQGSIEIPGVSVGFFEPQSQKYISRTTEPIKIDVKPGTAAPPSVNGGKAGDNSPSEASVKPSAPQLPGPMISGGVSAVSLPPLASPLASVLALIALFFKGLLELRSESALTKLRRTLQARWKKVDQWKSKSDSRMVGKEITNILYLVLGEISGAGGATQELGKLLAEAPPSVRRELGADFERIVEIFQTLSFAPEAAVGSLKEPEVLKKNIKEARALVDRALALADKDRVK